MFGSEERKDGITPETESGPIEQRSEDSQPADEAPRAEPYADRAEDTDNRAGETDRVNGEYHYKNGYTQKIYADAHYVPEGENTAPPRYYTPPEKQERTPKQKAPRESKRGGRAAFKAVCLCLVCALLGGFAGSALTGNRLTSRIDSLEEKLTKVEADSSLTAANIQTVQANSPTGVLTGSQVYDLACQQVVGISTDVTYKNLFGVTSSAPVSGTGFIVSENGYIVTNYHVIEYAYESNLTPSVIMHDGTSYEAAIVGVEESNDVAVLKIDAVNLKPVTLGNSDSLSVGDDVYAVGNPLGELDFSMTTGHVSALDRLIATEDNADPISMFQIDAAVNSGNSGGPVYNAKGEVVGIVTAKYKETGVEGIGFAIPINDAISIADDLINKGYVTGKAYMGVRLDNRYNSMYSQYYGMPIGAYVYSVDSGSCAEAAGIQAGDIITMLGDEEITDYNDLRRAVKMFSAGDSAEVTLYRAGESITVTVTFDEAKPDSMSDSPAQVTPQIGAN